MKTEIVDARAMEPRVKQHLQHVINWEQIPASRSDVLHTSIQAQNNVKNVPKAIVHSVIPNESPSIFVVLAMQNLESASPSSAARYRVFHLQIKIAYIPIPADSTAVKNKKNRENLNC